MSHEPTPNTSEPILWLTGQRVALGPLRRDLVETYWRWEQDPRALTGYGRQTPESLEARTEGLDHQLRNLDRQPRFTIYDVDGDDGRPAPVGTTVLRIDHYVRTAEFTILIGPEGRGRGLATEATTLTIDYGFHLCQLRAIWLKVLEPNIPAIRTYTAAGFMDAGRLRQAGYWLGQPCDELLMDITPPDLKAGSVLTPDS